MDDSKWPPECLKTATLGSVASKAKKEFVGRLGCLARAPGACMGGLRWLLTQPSKGTGVPWACSLPSTLMRVQTPTFRTTLA